MNDPSPSNLPDFSNKTHSLSMNTKETSTLLYPTVLRALKKEEKTRITLIHVCFISRTLGAEGWRVKRRVQEPKEKGDKKGVWDHKTWKPPRDSPT